MEAVTQLKYSIVIPVYNEQENVGQLYSRIVETMREVSDSYEIVFVDDGSRDDTFKMLSEMCERDARVIAVQLRKNFGQTAALKAGFDLARGEVIISMDGDLQHDPAEIPAFVAKLSEGYDVVSGWRAQRRDAWLTRRLPSLVANWLLARLCRVDLHDFGTTFKAYRREVITDLPLYGDMHRFIPALASWSGARIAEIPIKNVVRQRGKSNYGLSRTLTVVLDLICLKFLLDYSTKPLQFFGGWGLLSTGAGGLIGLGLIFKKFVYDIDVIQEHGPLLFMTVVLIVCGIQLISIGLIGEMLSRTYYESQKKAIYSVREVKRRISPVRVHHAG
jgi:glycosyltransferase involved in cell wall biosynthesis